MIDSQAGCFQH